jgi:hypothetical protein
LIHPITLFQSTWPVRLRGTEKRRKEDWSSIAALPAINGS